MDRSCYCRLSWQTFHSQTIERVTTANVFHPRTWRTRTKERSCPRTQDGAGSGCTGIPPLYFPLCHSPLSVMLPFTVTQSHLFIKITLPVFALILQILVTLFGLWRPHECFQGLHSLRSVWYTYLYDIYLYQTFCNYLAKYFMVLTCLKCFILWALLIKFYSKN